MKRWFWRQVVAETPLSGSQVWEVLFADQQISTLLESPCRSPLSGYSIVAGNPSTYWTPPVGQILPLIDQLQCSFGNAPLSEPALEHLPFTGGYLGWLGYDFAWEIEALPYTKPDRLPFPVAFWYEPQQFVVIDHLAGELWLASQTPESLAPMAEKLRQARPTPPPPKPYPSSSPRYTPDREQYQQHIQTAKHHIYAGDIFQANLSLRFQVSHPGTGWGIYRQLQAINPSPFSSYWRTPWGEVISASPERLVRVRPPMVETRPIAGTRPRGATPAADRALAAQLLTSPKELSEHIMLVDLERNDLGKVCKWGSVEVDELLVQEQYSHVVHLVSNVRGELRPDCTLSDILRGVFPGGTITGCPKVRCMQIIEALEPDRRSLFYGSCGYIDRRGHVDLNILIRTLLKQADCVWGQVGAGIVADSDPGKEWEEALYKAQAQLHALGVIAD